MRKSQKHPPQANRAPQGRNDPYGLGTSGYDELERPVRTRITTSHDGRQRPPEERVRYQQGNQYGTAPREPQQSRPVRGPYREYDLGAFDRERTASKSASSDYDLGMFSSERTRPAQTERRETQPVRQGQQAQRRPAPTGAYQRQGSSGPAKGRQTPPPSMQRERAVNRVQSGRGDPPARGGNVYRNREEQRRAQNQRRAKRLRRRRIASVVLLLLTVVIAAVVLCCTVFFKVDQIKIEGSTSYTNEQVLNMLNLKKGDNMLLINRKEQAEALPGKLPYVRGATIKLSLPSTVVVTIESAEPKYYFPSEDGTFVYLDQTLKVLETGAAAPPEREHIISLEGTVFQTLTTGKKAMFADEKLQKALEDIIAMINQVKLDKVTAIMTINETTNYVIYDGRITLKLGEAANLEQKLTLGKTSIEDTSADNVMNQPDIKGTLDLTIVKYAYFTESTE